MTGFGPEQGPVIDLHAPQRQSLWAVVFLAFRTLRSVGLVQLALFVGFVVARVPSVAAIAGLVAVVGVVLFAIAGLQWWRFTFEIEGEELVVQRGVLEQQHLSIPLGRVQSVSLEQKLLHRIVSLVQISLETAGTETAEFVIEAVDHKTAQALQKMVANYQRPPNAATEQSPEVTSVAPPLAERVILRHDLRRVVQIALTQMPFAGLLVLGPLLAVGDELGRFVPFDVPDFDEPTGTSWLFWFVPLALVVVLVTSLVLNLIRVLLTDWNLTVSATQNGLRRDAGLLSTTSVATPVPRIQMVRARQGTLERMAGLHTVQLATIGSTTIAVAGCSSDQAHALVQVALGGTAAHEDLTERVSSAEVFLRTRTAAVVAALGSVGLFFVVGWWSPLLLLSIPVVWARTRRQVRLRRWAIGTESVAQFQEFVACHRDDVLVRKVNGVTVSQRLFERKRGLATVVFSTAAGNLSIGMIPLAQAEHTRDMVLQSVETDHRVWM